MTKKWCEKTFNVKDYFVLRFMYTRCTYHIHNHFPEAK